MGRLFVYVPAISGRFDRWEILKEKLIQEPGCADDDFRHWPLERRDQVSRWSRGRLENYGARLAAQVDEWDQVAVRKGKPYDQIVLIGQSIGALLVRWAWLYGSGAFRERDARPWASKVRRIVLVAGLNRGVSTKLEPDRRSVQALVFKLLISITSPFGFAWKGALAGSPFVTNLRLTWMQYAARLRSDRQPEVVQFLGTNDNLVQREDSRDIEQFPKSAHVTIAGASHGDILDLSGPTAANRYLILSSHILETPEPTEPPSPEQARATDVVFVVHGIRAGAFGWVTEVRRLVSAVGTNWRVVVPTYRFFSALAFAIPVTRRRKVRWFLDQYSREVAKHPKASFHFVGHSNGTYLLGRALQNVGAVRFQRVYLAGSVLPATYPWQHYLDDTRQIEAIRSDRGNRDLPVALLARGLRGLGMRDVGDGGFEGFADLNTPPAIQWPFFPGGHGAPLATSDLRENVASYITKGIAEQPAGLIDNHGGALAVVSRFSPVLLLLATGLAVVVFWWAAVAPSVASVTLAGLLLAAFVALAFV